MVAWGSQSHLHPQVAADAHVFGGVGVRIAHQDVLQGHFHAILVTGHIQRLIQSIGGGNLAPEVVRLIEDGDGLAVVKDALGTPGIHLHPQVVRAAHLGVHRARQLNLVPGPLQHDVVPHLDGATELRGLRQIVAGALENLVGIGRDVLRIIVHDLLLGTR